MTFIDGLFYVPRAINMSSHGIGVFFGACFIGVCVIAGIFIGFAIMAIISEYLQPTR